MPELNEIKRSQEIGKGGYYRWIWLACEDCGKERWFRLEKVNKSSGLVCRSCAPKLRRGDKHPKWKGGRCLTSAGYVLVKIYPEDFFYPMANSHGYVLEHRLVMAKHLGRCLQAWELVHHKDGIKDHDEYSNLKMTTKGSHSLEHSKGYRDGYAKGLLDGRDKQIAELKLQNGDLMKQVKLIQWQIKERLFKEIQTQVVKDVRILGSSFSLVGASSRRMSMGIY